MPEKSAKIGPAEGLHARPAAQFVKTAKQFTSEIAVIKGERRANAKSPMKLPTLKAKKGDEIIIRAEGEDAEAAVEALAEFISREDH